MIISVSYTHLDVYKRQVLLGPSTGIREGSTVKRTQRIASLKVGEQIVGRVVNTLGEPIDGKGPIGGELYEMPLERKAPGVIFRQPVSYTHLDVYKRQD